MKRQHVRRAEKGTFQFDLVLGLFIVALLLGLFLSVKLFDPKSWMFWFFVVWTLGYALAIYCWVDDERYQKFEYYLTPVVYGLFFLLLAACGIGGFIYTIMQYFTGDHEIGNLVAAPIVLASFGMFAYFDFIFYLQPYLKKPKNDPRTKGNKKEDRKHEV